MDTCSTSRRRLAIIALDAAACLVSAACATNWPYPRSWSPRDAVADCGRVAGVYRERGESASDDARLSHWLLGAAANRDVTSVRLTLTNGTGVEVALMSASGTQSFALADRRQVSCRHGTLDFSKRATWGATAGVGAFLLGRVGVAVELQAAGDWLVACRKRSLTGLLMLLPWHSTTQEWARFERIPPADEPPPWRGPPAPAYRR